MTPASLSPFSGAVVLESPSTLKVSNYPVPEDSVRLRPVPGGPTIDRTQNTNNDNLTRLSGPSVRAK